MFSNYHQEYESNLERGFEKQKFSTSESEEALKEYNRILTIGGRIVIDGAHSYELPSLRRFKQGSRINGFIVEKIFDPEFDPHSTKISNLTFPSKMGPRIFVLKKVEDYPTN